MNIWLDLANSPQVLFFVPIIGELEKRGHAVEITTRRFAQTVELADRFQLRHTVIGGHGGSKLSGIGLSLLDRARSLAAFARGRGFDVALSHNSYAQALAALVLRIPFVTLNDYEHQPANHLAFRIASRVLVPECFPEWALKKYGAKRAKVGRYKGLKEQVYLRQFAPTPGYRESLGIPSGRVVAVVRPPGSWGLYHNFDNPLYDLVLQRLASDTNVVVVLLPRVAAQAAAARKLNFQNFWIPDGAIDGPDLLAAADLVISGGGTMNREAAVLGTPAYSIFAGRLPAVDAYLMEQQRLVRVQSADEVSQIPLVPKRATQQLAHADVVNQIVDEVTWLRQR